MQAQHSQQACFLPFQAKHSTHIVSCQIPATCQAHTCSSEVVCFRSHVQHSTKGASAAISVISWEGSPPSLQLAILIQPVQPPLPLLRHPVLHQWHSTTVFPMQQLSTPETPAGADRRPSAEGMCEAACSISGVLQAWHPTGIVNHHPPCFAWHPHQWCYVVLLESLLAREVLH